MANTKVIGDLIASGTITATNLADGAVTAAKLNTITTSSITEGTRLYYTDARVGSYLSANGYDTSTNIIAAITDSAPTTLDTLNELAAALGDDPNFATTITNSIATKLPLAGGTLTGNLGIGVTPSAWGTSQRVLEIGGPENGYIAFNPTNLQSYIYWNAYYDDANRYKKSSQNAAAFGFTASGDYAWYNAPSGTAGNTISFTQAMTLNASGNLSIGNTNDSYKLDVSGTAAISSLIVGGESTLTGRVHAIETGVSRDGSDSVAAGPWFRWTNANETRQMLTQLNASNGLTTWSYNGSSWSSVYTLTQSGNVGIGTNSPTFGTIDGYNQRGINIVGVKESGTAPVIRLTETGSGRGFFEIRSNRQGLTSGNMLQFGESSDTFMVIRADDDNGSTTTRGFVGIGTTTPGDKLHVYSSGYDANIRLTDAGVANADWSLLPSTGGSTAIFRLYNRSTAVVNQTWTPDGKVGIGTTDPSEKLDVIGVIRSRGANNHEGIITKEGSSGTFTFTSVELNGGYGDNINYFIFVSVYNPTTDILLDTASLIVHGVMPRGGPTIFSTISTLKGGGISTLTATNDSNSLVITTDSGVNFRCSVKVIAIGGTA